jgi:hypothetical protein
LTKRRKLFICFCISATIVTLQFTLDRIDHLQFQNKGKIAIASSTYSKQWSGDYANFSFTTDKGQIIEHSQKCGSKNTFDKEYANMKVIYNPENPEDFQNYYDFNNYSLTYRVFFFFGIYLTFLTFFLYILDRNIRGLYKFFKRNSG